MTNGTRNKAQGTGNREPSVERIAASAARVPLLVTCEHASPRLPAPWRWPPDDEWLVDTHWAYDLGAADIARELARAIGAPAVLSRFSRLLIDANRPPESPSLILREAEGRTVMLNATLGNAQLATEERARRMEYWSAYHATLAEDAAACNAPVLFAVHTFTPAYPGEKRDHIDVGILFDAEEELAAAVAVHLSSAGLRVLMNEPYSGKKGLIYAVDRHARAQGRRALEIEVRHDHAVDASFRVRIVGELARFAWPK